jgi:hypothetical protein
MLIPKSLLEPLPAAMAHLDELLDEALKHTFPASDPVAINVEIEPRGSVAPPAPPRRSLGRGAGQRSA